MSFPPTGAVPTVDALLAHTHWLRRLVVDLVGEQDADDVLQETWLAALRRPPRSAAAARTWLRRVARQLASKRRDRERRWQDRQRAAAQPEVLRPVDEMLAELESQRRVAACVTELPEPYRSVVLWRYLDELEVAAIAARRHVPQSTVRTQLSRGLEQLRLRLSARGSDWGALVLLPVLRGVAATTPGALVMSNTVKLILSAAAAGLLGGAWYFLCSAPPPASAPLQAASDFPAAIHGNGGGAVAAAEPEPVRAAVADAEEASSRAAVATVAGFVRDDRGAALAGVPLVFGEPSWGPSPQFEATRASGPPIAHSAADGSFAVLLPEAPCDVIGGDGWVTLRGAPIDPAAPERERFAVVAPRVRVSGRIVDESGRGVAGAKIGIAADLLGGFPGSLEATAIRPHEIATSGADGAFVHDRVPGTTQARLVVAKSGYFPPAEWACTAADARGVVIVLRRVAADGSELVACVVDPLDRPVPGALVTYGEQRATADADGIVRLQWLRRGWMLVCAKDHQLLELHDFDRAAWQRAGALVPMPLRLPGPALSIRGVVLAADGQPVPGLGVAIANAIMLNGEQRPAEQLAAGGGEHCLDWERTGPDGRFALGGLADRAYVLRFFDRATRLSVTTEPIAAGTNDVVVRVPADAVRQPLRGRVTTPDGAPLAGLRVRVMNQICQTPQAQLCSSWVETDANGAFALDAGPRCEGWIQLEGDAISPVTLELRSFAEQDEIAIVLGRRCLVRFLAAVDPTVADFVVPLDADGEWVQMLALHRGHPRPHQWWTLAEGRSPELAIPERAVELAFFKGGKVVKKEPLRLVPGQVLDVQL